MSESGMATSVAASAASITTMSAVDWLVVALYFGVLMALVIVAARRRHRQNRYAG